MTPWETVILPGQPAPVSLNEMLPGFTQEATQGTRVNDWKQIPGAVSSSAEIRTDLI